jgi:hypothetical protein
VTIRLVCKGYNEQGIANHRLSFVDSAGKHFGSERGQDPCGFRGLRRHLRLTTGRRSREPREGFPIELRLVGIALVSRKYQPSVDKSTYAILDSISYQPVIGVWTVFLLI